MKTVVIVQARMASTRLPGKVLRTILDKPLLEYQIERLRRIKSADEIVIATTDKTVDQPIVDLCKKLSIACFRGSEEDVLARYYGAAVAHQADVVVRITSDCPVIDPMVSDEMIRYFLKHDNEYDYLRLEQCPRGLDTEVVSFHALSQCFREAVDMPDREHVTTFIYRKYPERFRIKYIKFPQDLSQHRWTVDTPEDFSLLTRIITEWYPVKPAFDFNDILESMKKHPDWYFINNAVAQKKYGE